MRHLAASCLLFASAALAQDLDVNIDGDQLMPNVQINVRTKPGRMPPQQPQPEAPMDSPAPAVTATPPPSRTVGADAFSLDYSPMGVPAQTVKVLSPEGAHAQVWNESGALEGEYDVPFNFKGRGNTYYRFIITLPSGQLAYDRKIEVKQFLGATLRLRGAAAPPPPVAPQPPAPVAAPAAGMPPADFDALLEAVRDASFSAEKLGVVSTAASGHQFTVQQVGALVDEMSHSSDKVKVVEITRRLIVDRQNGFKLLQHFTFSSDKEKVQALLK